MLYGWVINKNRLKIRYDREKVFQNSLESHCQRTVAEVVSIFKKEQKKKNLKRSYRPVSILSNVSKIFQMCIYDQ